MNVQNALFILNNLLVRFGGALDYANSLFIHLYTLRPAMNFNDVAELEKLSELELINDRPINFQCFWSYIRVNVYIIIKYNKTPSGLGHTTLGEDLNTDEENQEH